MQSDKSKSYIYALSLFPIAVIIFLLVIVSLDSASSSDNPFSKGVSKDPSLKKLYDEQKYAAALDEVIKLKDAAVEKGDNALWTYYLVEEFKLKTSLHSYENGLKDFMKSKRPEHPLAKVVLKFYEAESFASYLQGYSWEIMKREKVSEKDQFDFDKYTKDEIAESIKDSFLYVFKEKDRLDDVSLEALPDFLAAGNYPKEVLSTLRDYMAISSARFFENSSYWTPQQSRLVFKLKLDQMLDVESLAMNVDKVVEDKTSHPLLIACSILAEEEKHAGDRGKSSLALELHTRRITMLFDHLTQKEDRQALIADLKKCLERYTSVSWYSTGCAELAELEGSMGDSECQVRAREIALLGRKAYPDSPGGQRCLSIISRIEAPDFNIEAMDSDLPGMPSIRVTHKNIAKLYFRLVPIDVKEQVYKNYEVPTWDDLFNIIKDVSPAAKFELELPKTVDYNFHSTFDELPKDVKNGSYILVGSALDTMSENKNKIQGCLVNVTNLVITSSKDIEKGIYSYRVVNGSKGEPVEGVSISAVKTEWRQPPVIIASTRSGREGEFTIKSANFSNNGHFFIFAEKGNDFAFLRQYRDWRGPYTPDSVTSLVFTDRRIYRVGQKILFKVVAFRNSKASGPFALVGNTSVDMELKDLNYQSVGKVTLTTDKFGSASGEFTIPSGRGLGRWSLYSSLNGSSTILVEEYKRPTFEVELKQPEKPLKLNETAKVKGEAKYYFGMPLTTGEADYTVSRTPRVPWWMWWYRPSQNPEIIESGTSKIKEDGTFEISFMPEADARLKSQKNISYNYSLKVNITDEGGETRGAEKEYRIGYVSLEAGIDPKSQFYLSGNSCGFNVSLADLNGKASSGKGKYFLSDVILPEKVTLPADFKITQEREGFKTEGDSLRPRWENDSNWEEYVRECKPGKSLQTGNVTFDDEGKGEISLSSLQAGVYRLRIETADPSGEMVEAVKDFVVAGDGQKLAVPFVLLAENSSVEVGDKARVLVSSAYEGTPVFVNIYSRSGLLLAKKLLSGSSAIIEIPATEELRGGIYAEAVFVKDHTLFYETGRVGVPWDNKDLTLAFEKFREKITPNMKEIWKVKIMNSKGAPVGKDAIQLLASMYDKSLDLFTPHYWDGISGFFPSVSSPAAPQVSLGRAEVLLVKGHGLYDWLSYPTFMEPSLLSINGYGVGGPGRRRYSSMPMQKSGRMRDGGVEGGVEGGLAESAPAPPPSAAPVACDMAAPREEKSKKENEAPAKQAGEGAAPEMRSNFSETAFFYPHLLSAADGTVAIEFVPPDSLTKYKVMLFAHGDGVVSGSLDKECEAIKDFMVRPYLPRFFREGDEIEIKVVVNNAGKEPLNCGLNLKIYDAATEKEITQLFNIVDSSRQLPVASKGSGNVKFLLKVPKMLGDVKIEVAGKAGDLTDGERRVIPVLPSRLHLVESKFITLREGETRKVEFDDVLNPKDSTRSNDKLVVTVDAQLLYGVLASMPYIVEYPYECTEQLMNKYVTVGILNKTIKDNPPLEKLAREFSKRETKYESFYGDDPNRRMMLEESPWLVDSKGGEDENPIIPILNPDVSNVVEQSSLRKLLASQDASGGWPWWAGGRPSPYMTLYICYGFSKAMEFGVEVPEEPIKRAFRYLKSEGLGNDVEWCMAHDCCWEFITFLNYTMSNFKDSSYYDDSFSDGLRRKMLDFSFKHWKEHTPYLKLQLAMTLKRMGRENDATLVHESVFDSAKTTRDEGTSWAIEDKSWLWYNDTVETQAFALKELMEIKPQDEKAEGLMVWLFLNKKLNHWKSTKATAEALYSILSYLKSKNAVAVKEGIDVNIGNSIQKQFVYEPDKYTGKKNQIVFEKGEITKDMGSIEFKKTGKGIAFASSTLHFSTDNLPEASKGDFFNIERTFYKRVQQGSGYTLEPFNPQSTVNVGDQIEVELKIKTKHEAEYVHIRAPRPSGCEPEKMKSGYSYVLGVYYYEEVRDSAEDFFIENLPQGEFKLRYRIRCAQSGKFRVGPATVESLYAPEFAAYSSGEVVKIGV
jgi:alpha-2-macroglobulin